MNQPCKGSSDPPLQIGVILPPKRLVGKPIPITADLHNYASPSQVQTCGAELSEVGHS